MSITDKIAYAGLCDSLAKNNHLQPQLKKELTNRAFEVLKSIDLQANAPTETPTRKTKPNKEE